ncbi:M949_RS01915 family surface polysaccharide biosynthesis protein [Mucilaginibacter myungsuensis]|uniref:Uncharacterized protein n=1 Tax=Mucilaginibacter myungsuensis TaxID=649104 RepID=A0A929PWF4_9SPHI|nr:hypothetical protein [Mucilaginibacter myungsuensis]MBE9662074.1 hypothetical protein [Mucilaginibacter myungsuensis]MDN3599492.1 hypothetical protein [Mucilaginibacter myungsuensis]
MKLTCTLSLLLSVSTLTVSAQIKVTNLKPTDISKSVRYDGKVINAARFSDRAGEHLIITTETGERPSKDKDFDGRDADLYAYHYAVNGAAYKQTWQMHDFIKDCPVDIWAQYLPNTFAITDLDKNGVAEVWLMYKTVCHGDVSPSTMKIIMHEGDKKYAVRGTNMVKVPGEQYGGSYTFDATFKAGPEVFRKYAADLWKKNLLETWK